MLFKQFSSSQINVSQNMFARSPTWHILQSLHFTGTQHWPGWGWVLGSCRAAVAMLQIILDLTIYNLHCNKNCSLLCLTATNVELVTTLKIRLLWPFCFMEQILFILFIFFIPQYWTLLLLNFLLSLHGSTALNEDRKISVLFFKTSVSN